MAKIPAKRKPNESSVFDVMARHQIAIERAKSGESKRIFSTVSAIDNDIKNIINSLPENYTQRQLEKAISSIDLLVATYYQKTVLTTLESSAATIVSFEVEISEDVLKEFLIPEGEKIAPVNKAQTLNKTLATSYQGKKLSTWTKQLGTQKTKDVSSMMRTKAAENATPSDMSSGVRLAVQKSNTASKSISDAYVNQSVNVSRDEVFSKNPEWVEEILWSSILDGNTTLTCGVRSNLRYNAKTKQPIDHDNEWGGGPGRIHWGCRSLGVPLAAGGKMLVDGKYVSWQTGGKTAIGAEKDYERGDNLTALGKKAKLPNANNKLEIQDVKASLNYESWLKQQPRAFIEDTLGVKKAAQFIDGKQSLQRFVVENGRELTVKELEKKLKSG